MTDHDTTTSIVVTAFNVPQHVYATFPGVLDCLPGDLGRYKGGECVILDLDSFINADVRRTELAAHLTAHLRRHRIAYMVETTVGWEPSLDATTTDETTTCRFCGHGIGLELDIWVAPDATDDDIVWRDYCPDNDTERAAPHEPVDDDWTWTEAGDVTTPTGSGSAADA